MPALPVHLIAFNASVHPRLHAVRLHDPHRLALIERLAVERCQVLVVERILARAADDAQLPLKSRRFTVPVTRVWIWLMNASRSSLNGSYQSPA